MLRYHVDGIPCPPRERAQSAARLSRPNCRPFRSHRSIRGRTSLQRRQFLRPTPMRAWLKSELFAGTSPGVSLHYHHKYAFPLPPSLGRQSPPVLPLHRQTHPCRQITSSVSSLSKFKLSLNCTSHSSVAIHSLESIAHLVNDTELDLKKVGIQCFASIYPLLFKHASVQFGFPSVVALTAFDTAATVQIKLSGHRWCRSSKVYSVWERTVQSEEESLRSKWCNGSFRRKRGVPQILESVLLRTLADALS